MLLYTYGIVVNGKPLYVDAPSLEAAKRKYMDEFKIDVDASHVTVSRLP